MERRWQRCERAFVPWRLASTTTERERKRYSTAAGCEEGCLQRSEAEQGVGRVRSIGFGLRGGQARKGLGDSQRNFFFLESISVG